MGATIHNTSQVARTRCDALMVQIRNTVSTYKRALKFCTAVDGGNSQTAILTPDQWDSTRSVCGFCGDPSLRWTRDEPTRRRDPEHDEAQRMKLHSAWRQMSTRKGVNPFVKEERALKRS